MGFGLTVSKIQKPPIGYKYPAEALLSLPSGNISFHGFLWKVRVMLLNYLKIIENE